MIRQSFEESYKLQAKSSKTPTNPCYVCKKTKHWARDWRYNKKPSETSSENSSWRARSSTSTSFVRIIVCKYCKKKGHTKYECMKLKYVNSKRNNPNHPNYKPAENSP